jgi:glutamate synthase domain-containing protein 1
VSNDVNVSLYAPGQERDACGTGFVADIAGKPWSGVLDVAHRGARDAEATTGDGPTGSEEA